MENKTIKLMPKDSHWYPAQKKKGVYWPSVTYVTGFLPKGQAFDRYLANQESYEESKRILEEAGTKGTIFHQMTEVLEQGSTISYETAGVSDDIYELLSFFCDWYREYNPILKHMELKLISDKHRLGGTCDRIYVIDGKVTLLDLKTSRSAIYDSHYLQISAYASMYEHLYKEKIDQVAILRVTPRRKSGYEYVIKPRIEWQKDYKQFKSTYNTMIYLSGGKVVEPKILEVPEVLSLK